MSRQFNPSCLHVAGIDICFTRKRIKNINLRIDTTGTVSLSAPLRCSMKKIEDFLEERKAWIVKHHMHFKSLEKPDAAPSYDQQQFLGDIYTVVIHTYATEEKVVKEGRNICCYLTSKACPERTRKVVAHWLKQQMEALLPGLIQHWETVTGLHAHAWQIKTMKTRWGSCNPEKKRIHLNSHLMHYPLGCLEYVIVHELVHLLEKGHNRRFYAFLDQFMPEWKVYQTLLRKR